MAVTKRDLTAVANILAEGKALGLFSEGNAHEIFTEKLADVFALSNPRFDGDRFKEASGVIKLTDDLSDPLCVGEDYINALSNELTKMINEQPIVIREMWEPAPDAHLDDIEFDCN